MNHPLRSFWSEPRPATVPRTRSDWWLLAALVALMVIEVALRDDLTLSSVSFAFGLALTPTILWRRSHPLLVTAIAFGVTGAFNGAGLVTGRDLPDLNTLVFLLLLPHALFRWGSGREALIGLPIILVAATLGLASDKLSFGEFLGGLAILLAPIAIGSAARYREKAQAQKLQDARSNERLNLARELHDTVAHHVSAIAVRAQAGIAVSKQDPHAAQKALRVIADEASRTLDEMREMVRVLRDDEPAELAPAPRLEDLKALTHGTESRTRVEVELSGETAKLSPALSGAIYRLAQESVTNARRHAREATRIRIKVTVDETSVRLRVDDDGKASTSSANNPGYGLIGMGERAQLFGGKLKAGPGPERGWTVTAILPFGRSEVTQ